MNNNSTNLFIKDNTESSFLISKILNIFLSNESLNENKIDDKLLKMNDNQKSILILVARIASSFSIIGILFVIFIFTCCRSVRSFVLELAVWLCATNLFFNICLFIPNNFEDNSCWCVLLGIISTWSYLSTNIWTSLIGFFSYFSVIKSSIIDRNKKYIRLIFIAIAYFIPGIVSLM
jgi:hypothetical protein